MSVVRTRVVMQMSVDDAAFGPEWTLGDIQKSAKSGAETTFERLKAAALKERINIHLIEVMPVEILPNVPHGAR